MPPHESESDERPKGRGAVWWVKTWWRALLAEVVATALLVWLGIGSAIPVGDVVPPLSHVACAFGFVVIANAVAFGHISGAHMNPAVSLAAAIYGQISWGIAAAYAIAQCFGAVLGFAGLMSTMTLGPQAGLTLPNVGVFASVFIEAAITGMLVLAVCGAWATHNADRPDHSVPIKLGLVVAGLVYVAGTATGASLNPARSLGPALLQNHWEHLWVYFVGPLLGGALAALFHRYVMSPPARSSPQIPEEVPLDKP